MRNLDLIVIAAMLLAGLAGLTAFVNYAQERQCYATAAAMGVKAEYNVWTPCVIDAGNGVKMPLSNYRGIQQLGGK